MGKNKDYEEPLLPMEPIYSLFDGEDMGVYDIADACGFSRGAFSRWERDGGLTILRAEQVAEHLGLHPTAIWGNAYNFTVMLYDERSRKMKADSVRKKRRNQKELTTNDA